MKLGTRIRQSEVRVRSGSKAVALFVAVAVVALAFRVVWVAKMFAVVAAFFAAVIALEYWNAWRLKRRLADEPDKRRPTSS